MRASSRDRTSPPTSPALVGPALLLVALLAAPAVAEAQLMMFEVAYPQAFTEELFALSDSQQIVDIEDMVATIAERGEIRYTGDSDVDARLYAWIVDAEGDVSAHFATDPFVLQGSKSSVAVGAHLDGDDAIAALRASLPGDVTIDNYYFPDTFVLPDDAPAADNLSAATSMLDLGAGSHALVLVAMPAAETDAPTLTGAAIVAFAPAADR